MQYIIATTTAISMSTAFCLIAYKFMLPKRSEKFLCFFFLVIIQLLFVLFFPAMPGITDIAFLFYIVVITFFIFANIKSYLRSLDIALTIYILFTISVYITAIPMGIIFSFLLGFSDDIMSLIMQVAVLGIGVLIKKNKDKFFKLPGNEKILKFYLTLKILLFIILNFIVPLSTDLPLVFYSAMSLFIAIIIVGLFLVKYNSKLVSELEKDSRQTAFKLVNMEMKTDLINERYFEVVRVKHFFNALYRSLMEFIVENDMPGLKDYFEKHIVPVHKDFIKKADEYEQVKIIQVPILRTRIVELINAISQMPNVKLSLTIRSVVTYVKMEDIDLFTVINVWIENAIDEVAKQEDGHIRIEISQTEKKFIFDIMNSIVAGKSTPKPNNTNKGLSIVDEILSRYPNATSDKSITYFHYMQKLEVHDK